jgi:alpha-galactosidase
LPFPSETRRCIRAPLSRKLSPFVVLAAPVFLLAPFAYSADSELKNEALLVRVNSTDGSYSIATKGGASPVVRAGVAAEVDHHWIKSGDYPKHEIVDSDFADTLGRGHQITVTSKGLADRPDLTYVVRVYDKRPFGEIQVSVQNHSGRALQIESIRSVEALGAEILNLHASPGSDRVLSDSFSEDWPPLQIHDLGKAPDGMHRAVGSQLIYNQQSKESAFFGALTADRLLTIIHLKAQTGAAGTSIASFMVESTGTTEIQATEEESEVRQGPKENLIELNLPLTDSANISSERLMFTAGSDYHAQLENYGAAIRELHHSRIAEDNLLGWWSWTAFYMRITEGNTFTNALWLAEHLKSLGYNLFHFDFGYGFARSDYAVPNATKFPHGMRPLTDRIRQLGLTIGIWTAPFEVGERSSVYEQHKDWLVHNANGVPIPVINDEEVRTERLFVLDSTNPAAQEFLRQTYHTLVREWGAKYIKLDFMDDTAIEGNYFRPNTTALEAERIGLQIIREAVGPDVLLDKDGSPMLSPVGIVDEGRTSQDTGHTFARSKEAAPGIAARYYMHRNFYIADPDAFTVSKQLLEEREIQSPLTLPEAEVSIALSAVSGGMFEIGDDLPTLGKDLDRVALLKNVGLLQIAKLGRASVPLDLLSYPAEDEQPSVFLLREDARKSILSVFNWTEKTRTHRFSFSELKLLNGHKYELTDILEQKRTIRADGDSLPLEQPAHSVRMIEIIDPSIVAAAPSVTLQAADHGKVDENLKFSCSIGPDGVPALAYHWDFGDGTTEDGRQVSHAYTLAGNYTVRLAVDGVDGISAEKKASVSVSGFAVLEPPTRYTPE